MIKVNVTASNILAKSRVISYLTNKFKLEPYAIDIHQDGYKMQCYYNSNVVKNLLACGFTATVDDSGFVVVKKSGSKIKILLTN